VSLHASCPQRSAAADNPISQSESSVVLESCAPWASLDQSCSASSIYPKLRAIARSRLRFGRDVLLNTTALVHESYIRFASAGHSGADHWPTFLRYSPRIMHNIVVECLRRRYAQVHGAGAVQVDLDTGLAAQSRLGDELILAVRQAIEQLHTVDARLAQVVEMRYFGGMTEPEIASALGVAERTVRRDWEKAKLLLAQAFRR
jgi:RNA polymerase sigma factor (TIGR02999 family)